MAKKQSKPRIDLSKFNVHGLDHGAVKKRFEGELTYIGTFCVKDEYSPRAFYFNAKPDKAKGHKEYMTLQTTGKDRWFVSGMSKSEMKEWRYTTGLQCLECKDVIYSVYRHDMRYCKCGETFVDGGRDYSRAGGPGVGVTIDLVKGEWKLI